MDSGKLRTGRLTDADWTKIARRWAAWARSSLWIDDNPALTVEIRARRVASRTGWAPTWG